MPKGPKGQKHPADVIGNAVKIMRIARARKRKTSAPTMARTRLRSRWVGAAARRALRFSALKGVKRSQKLPQPSAGEVLSI
jgi:hypothetical protein